MGIRFTSGHETVGGEEEDSKIMEEPSDELQEKVGRKIYFFIFEYGYKTLAT